MSENPIFYKNIIHNIVYLLCTGISRPISIQNHLKIFFMARPCRLGFPLQSAVAKSDCFAKPHNNATAGFSLQSLAQMRSPLNNYEN